MTRIAELFPCPQCGERPVVPGGYFCFLCWSGASIAREARWGRDAQLTRDKATYRAHERKLRRWQARWPEVEDDPVKVAELMNEIGEWADSRKDTDPNYVRWSKPRDRQRWRP